jgi:hypothetical protein
MAIGRSNISQQVMKPPTKLWLKRRIGRSNISQQENHQLKRRITKR